MSCFWGGCKKQRAILPALHRNRCWPICMNLLRQSFKEAFEKNRSYKATIKQRIGFQSLTLSALSFIRYPEPLCILFAFDCLSWNWTQSVSQRYMIHWKPLYCPSLSIYTLSLYTQHKAPDIPSDPILSWKTSFTRILLCCDSERTLASKPLPWH